MFPRCLPVRDYRRRHARGQGRLRANLLEVHTDCSPLPLACGSLALVGSSLSPSASSLSSVASPFSLHSLEDSLSERVVRDGGRENKRLLLALSVSTIRSRRGKFFEDCKPFLEVFSLKNILLHIGKASILVMSLAGLEYNNYLDRVLIREREGENDNPPFVFDWEKYSNFFSVTCTQMIGTAVIRRTLEYFARLDGSALADKLTKDVGNSLKRKLMRYSSTVATYKIFSTACRGNLLNFLSLVSYDAVKNAWLVPRDQISTKKVIRWIRNKAMFIFILVPLTSAGYAFGSFMTIGIVGSSYADSGGVLTSLAFDAIGNIIVNSLGFVE